MAVPRSVPALRRVVLATVFLVASCGGGAPSSPPAGASPTPTTVPGPVATAVASPAPTTGPTTAATAAPSVAASGAVTARSWTIDEPSGGGRLIGEHCGGLNGEWIVDGTYDRMGAKGTQRWAIDLASSTMTGTFTYTDDQRLTVAGITVSTEGYAEGTIAAALDDAGRVRMALQETFHEFYSTTSAGGMGWEDAPLQSSELTWQPSEAAC